MCFAYLPLDVRVCHYMIRWPINYLRREAFSKMLDLRLAFQKQNARLTFGRASQSCQTGCKTKGYKQRLCVQCFRICFVIQARMIPSAWPVSTSLPY